MDTYKGFKLVLSIILVLFMVPSMAFANPGGTGDESSSSVVGDDNSNESSSSVVGDDNSNESSSPDDPSNNPVEDETQDGGSIVSSPGSDEAPDDTNDSTDPEDSEDAGAQDAAAVQDAAKAREAEEGITTQSDDISVQATSALAEGNYYISSALNARQVLDVSGGSKSNGANVQLYSTNITKAQQWKVTIDSAGYATITNINSGKVLDVAGAQAKNGTNVWQYSPNKSKAQKWIITKDSKGYMFTSALSSKMVLDVNSAFTANGTNIQLFQSNNTLAQRFLVTDINVTPASGEQCIEDGTYVIKTSYSKKVIDIYSGYTNDGANAQIFTPNGSLAQSFQFVYDANTKCYTIQNLASGKMLDAKDGNPIKGSNVQQWSANGSDAQKWAISKVGDTYTFINRANGCALDVSKGSSNDGANVQTYEQNGGSAQKFTLSAADLAVSGVYAIRTAVSGARWLDVPGASTANNAQLQIYEGNNTISQKYVIKREGNSVISMRSLISGLRIADNNGKLVQQKANDSDSQKWIVTYQGGGFVLKNKATGNVMNVSGGATANGTKVQTSAPNNSRAQRFYFISTEPVDNGCYFIQSACAPGKCLDFNNSSWYDGTNLQIWEQYGGSSQKFEIIGVGNGYYRITSNHTWSNIDVAGGGKSNGTNVWMYTSNNTKAQKWRVVVTEDGWYSFQNANGKYLDVSAGKNANGTNVAIYQGNGSSAQKFRLKGTPAASISGNSELDFDLRATICNVGKNGNILNKCYWYVVSSNYYARHSGNSGWGILSNNETKNRALVMYRYGSGTCYEYAAQFMWLARALGYSANVRSGGVPSASGGIADHSWTEIYSGGTKVCDPNLQRQISSRDFYWRTYANAPIDYHL